MVMMSVHSVAEVADVLNIADPAGNGAKVSICIHIVCTFFFFYLNVAFGIALSNSGRGSTSRYR